MVWRDFTLRYKQTFVGAGWAILQPLGLTAVFAIFLGRIVPNPVEGLPYALFVLPAMVLWQFFLEVGAPSRGSASRRTTTTVTKVFFPRLYLPLAMIVGGLIDLGFALFATTIVMVDLPRRARRGDRVRAAVRRCSRSSPRSVSACGSRRSTPAFATFASRCRS